MLQDQIMRLLIFNEQQMAKKKKEERIHDFVYGITK
jgi:hypothetical protein